MPNGDGAELIAEIRRRADIPPVIVITGDDNAAQILTEFDNIQLLYKPANADDILGALDLALCRDRIGHAGGDGRYKTCHGRLLSAP